MQTVRYITLNLETDGMSDRRYILQHSTARPDGWVLTDTVNGVVITFDEHRFNETQKVTFLADDPSKGHNAQNIAHILQEMGQWVAEHHGSVAFDEVYGIEIPEEGQKLFFCRNRHPRWRMEIQDHVTGDTLTDSLKKAIEWLRKGIRR